MKKFDRENLQTMEDFIFGIAYDYDKNVVGQIDDVFTPGDKKVQHNTAIPARSTPVSGAISSCQIR